MLPPSDYLTKIKPFSFLDEEQIDELIKNMHVSLYKTGKTVFKKGKVLDRIYLVRDGELGLFDGNDLVEVIGNNEFTGLASAIKKEKMEFEGRAISDTICFEFRAKDIEEMMSRNREFAEFIEKILRMRFSEIFHFEEDELMSLFSKKVSDVIFRDPVTCDPESTLGDVVRMMRDHGVGSVIVVNRAGNPIGIITHTDIINALASNLPMSSRAEELMSSPVVAVDLSSSLLDAYIKFIESAVNHLAVARDGKLAGVITIKDLMKSFEPRSSLLNYPKIVKKMKNVDELENLIGEVISSMRNMLRSGLNYETISSIYIPVFDQILRQVLKKVSEPDTTIAITGDFGRRELTVPPVYRLLVIEGRISNGKFSEYYSLISRDEFEEDAAISHLVELADSRYIIGSGAKYISFKDRIGKNVLGRRDELISLLRKELKEKITPENCDERVEKIARIYSVLNGEFTSKTTVERLKSMDLDPETISLTAEIYSTVKLIRLREKKIEGKSKTDSIILKKSVGVIRNFRNVLKEGMKAW